MPTVLTVMTWRGVLADFDVTTSALHGGSLMQVISGIAGGPTLSGMTGREVEQVNRWIIRPCATLNHRARRSRVTHRILVDPSPLTTLPTGELRLA